MSLCTNLLFDDGFSFVVFMFLIERLVLSRFHHLMEDWQGCMFFCVVDDDTELSLFFCLNGTL